MPPIGHDDQAHALHVLNAVMCAKSLIADLTLAGGLPAIDGSNLPDTVKDGLRMLFGEISKLQVYESRAAARGTLYKLNDEKLAQAVRDVREARILTGNETEVLAKTAEEIAETFSLDDEPTKADVIDALFEDADPNTPPVLLPIPEPDTGDSFEL